MSKSKIGVLTDFIPGKIKGVTVQGHDYVITNVDGSLYAIDGLCPHAKAKMAGGKLEGNVITCPKHSAEYDVKTGKNLKKPHFPFAKGVDIPSYKVLIEGQDVYLDL